MCVASNQVLEIYGDQYADKYAVLVLQVRPCQTFAQIEAIMTSAQISTWTN